MAAFSGTLVPFILAIFLSSLTHFVIFPRLANHLGDSIIILKSSTDKKNFFFLELKCSLSREQEDGAR